MAGEQWVVVDSVSGDLQAEILRGLLEAQGITVFLSQEGAGHFGYSLTVGALGKVELLVPESQAAAARQVLDAYYAGDFSSPADGSIGDEPGED